MLNTLHYLIHTIIYYITWFTGITLAARGDAWISSLIVIAGVVLQLYWEHQKGHSLQELWLLLAIVVFISTLIDSTLVYKGIIIYAANPFSPYFTSLWMIAIWISFTVTLHATLRDLFSHLFLLALLSGIGFFLAFRVGASLGAVFFPYGTNLTCIFIGVIWSFLLPFCVYGYQKIKG